MLFPLITRISRSTNQQFLVFWLGQLFKIKFCRSTWWCSNVRRMLGDRGSRFDTGCLVTYLPFSLISYWKNFLIDKKFQVSRKWHRPLTKQTTAKGVTEREIGRSKAQCRRNSLIAGLNTKGSVIWFRIFLNISWTLSDFYGFSLATELSVKRIEEKNDHRSKFSNLSNWEEEVWKNQGFNGIRTRDLRDTGAMLYQLSYEATHWEEVNLLSSHLPWGVKWCDFFRLLLSNCLNWKIYCDDHSSLWSTTVVQIYEFFHLYFTSELSVINNIVLQPCTNIWVLFCCIQSALFMLVVSSVMYTSY